MRFSLFFLLAICFALSSTAQLKLIQSPASKAFIPQNKLTRSAEVLLSGEVDQNTFTHINIKVFRGTTLISNSRQNLNFINGIATYKQKVYLKTGKYLYSIRYELSGGSTFTHTIDDILVGDVYLIQGQSNAVAASYNPFNTNYYSDYLRSFGTANRTYNTVRSDTFWHPINAINPGREGSVGQWAAVLAKHVLDSFNTPICLLNGAVGGTRIDQHQPNLNNLEDLFTIYGRLLYRVRKANLDSSISGILYFQGESDGGLALKHDTGFTNLYHHWKRDYPGFQKLYVVQVRDGCGNPSLQLREVQRQFEFKLPNCQTVSANGLNNHDNCHYGFVNGYEKLGYQLSKLVACDFYWPTETTNINPPNIDHCYYTDGLQREIKLVMGSTRDLLFVDNNFESLFELVGDNSVQIVSGKLENNIITLQLSKSSCNLTGLSYNGKRGNQPWVTNKTGMGLISFYNQPIYNFNIEQQRVTCKGAISTIGVTALPGITYSIEQLSNGNIKHASSMRLLMQKSDSFMLRMRFDSLACTKSDSVIIYTEVDPVIVPEFGSDTALCVGDSLVLAPNTSGFKRFIWFNDSKIYPQLKWTAKENGVIRLDALSNNSCNYSDEIDVSFQQVTIGLDSVYETCIGASATIELSEDFKTIYWNNLKGTKTFTSNQIGTHAVYAINDIGCFAIDSFLIANYPNAVQPTWDSLICANATVLIHKPQHAQKWLRNGNEYGASFYVLGEQHIPMVIIDSNQCTILDTIDLVPHPTIDYPKTIDTANCAEDALMLALPPLMHQYYFDGRTISSNQIQTSEKGIFSYGFIDNNQCDFNGELTIGTLPKPSLAFFRDTFICAHDSMSIDLNQSVTYKLNSIPVSENIVLKPGQSYLLEATSTDNCSATKSIKVQSIDCTSDVTAFSQDDKYSFYPNPFTETIHIQSNQSSPISVAIYTIQGKLIWKQHASLRSGLSIDLAKCSNGVYLLQIENEFHTIVKRK